MVFVFLKMQGTESPDESLNNTLLMCLSTDIDTINNEEEINLINESVISFDALFRSMYKCKQGVIWKESVASYVLNGIERTLALEEELHNGTYKPRPPVRFVITSPKKRDILSISFRDRVYQRSLNDNVVYPYMTKDFIYDNCSCQKNKGTDFARNRLKCFLHKHYRKNGNNGYVLQIDIKGYYPNMRHDVCKKTFQEKLPSDIYKRVEKVLDTQYLGDIGYNAGSQMVQIAGISVLNPIDQYAKYVLGIKYYIRYMDDIIIIDNDINKLKEYKELLAIEFNKLGFQMHDKKTKIFPIRNGISFLGFKYFLNDTGKVFCLINPENVKRERKKLRRLVNMAKKGKITKEDVNASYESWKTHAKHGNSYKLIKKMDNYYKSLWKG